MSADLTIALRALMHWDPNQFRRKDKRRKQKRRERQTSALNALARAEWPSGVLVFDTETTIDPSQRLLFACYRLYEWTDDSHLRCTEEGLFHADTLATWRPEEYAVLARYAKQHRADVARGEERDLKLLTRREFLDRVFWPIAYQARALVVAFNLPFDLSRIADDAAEGRYPQRDSFSFRYWSYDDPASGNRRERTFRPRVRVQALDSKGAFIAFTHPQQDPHEAPKEYFGGHFVDAKTLAFALSGESYTLEKACKAFGVTHGKTKAERHGVITPRYIEYCRHDVRATAELLERLRVEFDAHQVSLAPWKAYSAASISKALLTAMRIQVPRVHRSARNTKLLSRCMSAYFGGRAECHVRRTPVPVVTVDYTATYPTVNALMKNAELLTAERVEFVEDTDAVRAFLDRVTVDACFDPATWPELRFLVELEPDADSLPIRGRYDPDDRNFQIGVNVVSSRHPLWYMGPDVVASAVLTGKVPKVRKAYRLAPIGRQADLTFLAMGGNVHFDPAHADVFRTMVEERERVKADHSIPEAERGRVVQALKGLANSGAYGIWAEMNPQETPVGRAASIRVHGLDRVFGTTTHAPEKPGPFFFPPLAALIPAGARLMLALLECLVRDLGGTHAFTDTDSMAIVASARGGRVPCAGGCGDDPRTAGTIQALTWPDVDGIVARFEALNPYDRTRAPGSILKIEKKYNYAKSGAQRQLYAYVISAKRYALFTQRGATVTIVKASEHGLGYLLNPIDPECEDRDWIAQLWEFLIRHALGQRPRPPKWLDRPAVSRVAISKPGRWRQFHAAARGCSYDEAVKPFGFLVAAHVAFQHRPKDADPARFQLVAPYEKDASKWFAMPWMDLHTGREYGITTSTPLVPELVRVQSFADVLAEFRTHPEPKSADASGVLCTRQTRGLLTRRRVHVGPINYIGKEANRIEDVEAGLVHSLDDVLLMVDDPQTELWRESAKSLAARHGVSTRTIKNWRNKVRR